MIPALSLLGSVAAGVVGDSSPVGATVAGAGGSVSSMAGSDFGSVLAQVTSDAVDKLKAGEATAISGLEGKASVQQVAKSVMDAQQSLQTVIAIRDRVVSAYQEVSRMAI